MRLTVEEDRETIRRYGHIKPGRRWGKALCSSRCPGTTRTCTLEKHHRGPHVAHSMLKKVVAVWDTGGTGTEVRRSGENARGAVVPRNRGEVWTGGVGGILEAVGRRVALLGSSVGDFAMLILLIGFVVFAVKWFLLIMG